MHIAHKARFARSHAPANLLKSMRYITVRCTPPRYTQKRSSSETGRRAADQGGSFLLPATLTFTTHYPLRDRLPYTPIPSPSPNGASYAHIARTARYLGLPGLQDPGQAQSGPVCPQLPITDLPPHLSHPR